ncbi:sigma-54-dependent Fis family transcriptional regulator [Fibrobacter sp.]|uniref:sigma-54 interaction domain-containing protein n=1 Tax=Fibrobacter sp. TaxID=35828 RepID=UPI0025BC2F7B|nr:sigma-54 dependent transcriptional regulator [Fibrobacter sp.]MCI6436446.1 sigma-54 dependent transcriptional regulator [Fibrobacter sp.]MDD7498856.1 sigma-54 dependent transcriptional regulator [Fibrobacter sp.]MDY5725181.1 sigma-54 dependent transcriptional regulator [Fibrobacter sp.]
MATISLYAKENATSSFIQDVFSSVDYQLDFFHDVPAADAIPQVTLIIWDLDSFPESNLETLTTFREKSPDTLILVYAENPERFSEISNKLYDSVLSVESLKLHLMSRIAKLKEIHNARMIFRERMSHLVGKSPAMQSLRKIVERAIVHTGPVLIQGETGVGKELIAQAVACVYDKFVTVNCSAIPDNLFESELFGHTRGAFTGAQNERIGLFEAADGGAIFLDEIGDMPLHAQVKLLRVLQSKEIRPLGANRTKHIDVRIIAATNRDLQQEIAEKRFREDLYYRLNVIPVQISPLRERKEDIEDLANYFIRTYQTAGENYSLSSEALIKLQEYDWPGNIRELENVIQRALCFTSAGTLRPEDIQIGDSTAKASSKQATSAATEQSSTGKELSDYENFRQMQLEQERKFLIQKIRECNGSVREAAQKLGLFRTALYNRLNHLGVDIKEITRY